MNGYEKDPRAAKQPIAHLWQTRGGFVVEIANGAWPYGFEVLAKQTFKKKADAKQFAADQGARPWNY